MNSTYLSAIYINFEEVCDLHFKSAMNEDARFENRNLCRALYKDLIDQAGIAFEKIVGWVEDGGFKSHKNGAKLNSKEISNQLLEKFKGNNADLYNRYFDLLKPFRDRLTHGPKNGRNGENPRVDMVSELPGTKIKLVFTQDMDSCDAMLIKSTIEDLKSIINFFTQPDNLI